MPFCKVPLRVTAALMAFCMPLLAFAQEQVRNDGITLLEPIGGVTFIPTTGNEGLGVFGFYFNLLYPWVIGMGAGIAVLNAVWGGLKIIQAGSGDGVSEGKNKLMMSLVGLLFILASATILNALNPTFFK